MARNHERLEGERASQETITLEPTRVRSNTRGRVRAYVANASVLYCHACRQAFAAPLHFHGGTLACPYCGYANTYAGASPQASVPPVDPTGATFSWKTKVLAGCGLLIFYGMCNVFKPEDKENANVRAVDGDGAAHRSRSAPQLQAADEPPESAAAPLPSDAAFTIASYEAIDCRAKARPDWCRNIEYATKAERAGTVVLVVRSSAPGKIHECWSTPQRTWYNGHAGEWTFPAKELERLDARLVTLVPAKQTMKPIFFVVPPEREAALVEEYRDKTLGPCPVAAELAGTTIAAARPAQTRTVTVHVEVADRKANGKGWDIGSGAPDIAICTSTGGGHRCFPGDVVPSDLTGHGCKDTYACSIEVEVEGSPVALTVVDADAAAHDEIASGTCAIGKKCDLGLASVEIRR